jgi:hypothetical protein
MEAVLSQILDLSRFELDTEHLAGCHIERPKGPSESSTYALEMAGWVVGRRVPAVAVEVVHNAVAISRIPLTVTRRDLAAKFPRAPNAELSGFFTFFNSLRLPPHFSFKLRAVLENNVRVDIGALQGSRSPIGSSFQPRLQPLMVTSLGRSGSTLLVSLLATHPQIAAYRPYDCEPRVATYWMGVLQALSDPASYLSQIRPAGQIATDTWWLGTDAPAPRPAIDDGPIMTWMGRNSVVALAATCQARIDALYRRVATHQGQDAGYFVEKFLPPTGSSLITELYPSAREIVLVRDFRDMVCSIFAYNAKKGVRAFGRDLADSEEDFVRRLQGSVLRLARHWQQASASSHLVLYEDLILRPAETLEGILKHLGVDAEPARVDAMLQTLWSMVPQREVHATTADPNASIGRWRRDLSPRLKEISTNLFGPALEEFGYMARDESDKAHSAKTESLPRG